RVDAIKAEGEPTDFTTLDHIEIGVLGGDGIGPSIAHESQRVLEALLEDQVASGRVSFRTIDGLTIERRAEEMAAIPEGVLKEIHECDVTLKGPTTTPEQGDGWPNIESANVAMRKVLDLYANVRPVRVPAEGIDWTFFRENTEDLYAVGSEGFSLGDLNIDFKILSNPGSERIIRAAFDYAKNNGKDSVTIVTKANVVKTTDGAFLDAARRVAEDYDGIEWEGWYIDIMTAKLVDPKRRTNFQVFALPNLYGDILTDEAAEFQGGVGTAGAGNIGTKTAMFEAIHGSAPRMVREGRDIYADPSSMLRAGAMMLSHIGFPELGGKLDKAMDLCGQYEKELVMTGRDTGATTAAFGDYVLATVNDSTLDDRWRTAIEAVRAGS
ncbi:MAG: isocitrate/isopropylmalate dehydrogenase family protein, partial [Chloroflexi bacterium]|nr:isocitrate/isopropylmalate dehydrogenase family protein [Chloroflexota bacterium]